LIFVDHREVGKRASDVYPYAIHACASLKEKKGAAALSPA